MGATFPKSETDPVADARLDSHEAETTAVHGIPDTAELATKQEVAEAGGGGGEGKGFTWEDVVLGSNVVQIGSPYAPKVMAGQNGDIAHLSGLLEIGPGGIAPASVMFTLPVAARPTYKKVITLIDANNAQSSSLMVAVVEPDGKVKNAVEFGPSKAPAFDNVSYSLEH